MIYHYMRQPITWNNYIILSTHSYFNFRKNQPTRLNFDYLSCGSTGKSPGIPVGMPNPVLEVNLKRTYRTRKNESKNSRSHTLAQLTPEHRFSFSRH